MKIKDNIIYLIFFAIIGLILINILSSKQENFSESESHPVVHEIKDRMKLIIEHCRSNNLYPKLVSKFPFITFREVHDKVLRDDPNLTSYSLNKKEMFFCVKHREDKTVYDINLLTYVAVHELAHIATESIGHTPEWKTNFKVLLDIAIELKLYEPIRESREYCGMQIHSF